MSEDMLASGCMSRSAGKLGSSPGAMSVGGSEAGGGSQARRKTASGSGLSDLEKPRPIEMADAQIAAESISTLRVYGRLDSFYSTTTTSPELCQSTLPLVTLKPFITAS